MLREKKIHDLNAVREARIQDLPRRQTRPTPSNPARLNENENRKFTYFASELRAKMRNEVRKFQKYDRKPQY